MWLYSTVMSGRSECLRKGLEWTSLNPVQGKTRFLSRNCQSTGLELHHVKESGWKSLENRPDTVKASLALA